jgi:hypothetical protein
MEETREAENLNLALKTCSFEQRKPGTRWDDDQYAAEISPATPAGNPYANHAWNL